MKENRSKLKAAFGRLGRIHLIVLECVAVALLVGSAYAAVTFSGGGTNPGTGGESASLPQEDHQTGLSPASQEETAWNAASSGLPQEETSLSLPEESGINASQLQTELLQSESGPMASSRQPIPSSDGNGESAVRSEAWDAEPFSPSSDCCRGILGMSEEELRRHVDRLDLFHHVEPFEQVSSGRIGELDQEAFYEIMDLLKGYQWSEHQEHVSAYELGAYSLEVIGHDTIHTYLLFARNQDGVCFAWSSNDRKITGLSEKDFTAIEEIIRKLK